jgi:hypothetical protein
MSEEPRTAEKRGKNANDQRAERIKQYRFKPGNPGGPGRPKGSRSFTSILEEVAEYEAPERFIEKLKESGVQLPERSWLYVLAAVALAKAAGGSVRHLEIVLDRLLGKPKQPVDASVNILNIDHASEEVKAIVQEYNLLKR